MRGVTNTVCLIAALVVLAASFELSGQLVDVPNFQLVDKDHIVNGDNLAARCTIRLTSLDKPESEKLLIDKNYKFKSSSLKNGKYDLIVNCHDFTFKQDRFIIDVDEQGISATDYYLDKPEFGESKNVTNDVLLVETVSPRQYYEIRLNSLSDMVMNSPLGFIFKNKVYTFMFVFSAVMMVGPYLLKFFNPEMAKRLEEIQKEQSKQGTILIDPNAKKTPDPKVEEISRSAPNTNARRRKR